MNWYETLAKPSWAPQAAVMLLPYLVWVCIATALQVSITVMDR